MAGAVASRSAHARACRNARWAGTERVAADAIAFRARRCRCAARVISSSRCQRAEVSSFPRRVAAPGFRDLRVVAQIRNVVNLVVIGVVAAYASRQPLPSPPNGEHEGTCSDADDGCTRARQGGDSIQAQGAGARRGQRSRKVRAICSRSGLSRYSSGVRSWVWMKTSAGMPGTRWMSLRRITWSAGSAMRTV